LNTLQIDNGSSGTFDAAATFARVQLEGGTLSGSADVACMEDFTWSGGTLTGTGSTTIPAQSVMTLSGSAKVSARPMNLAGTLTGAPDLTLQGTGHTWTGGTMSGAGKTLVAGGATFSLAGGTTKSLSRATENLSGGLVTWSEGTLSFANATLINRSGGTFRVDATLGNLIAAATTGTNGITNEGSLEHIGTTSDNTAVIGVPFTSSGVVSSTRHLIFAGGGSATGDFTATVAGSGGTIAFDSDFALAKSVEFLGNGRVQFGGAGSTYAIPAQFAATLSAIHVFPSANVTFNSPVLLNGAGSIVLIQQSAVCTFNETVQAGTVRVTNAANATFNDSVLAVLTLDVSGAAKAIFAGATTTAQALFSLTSATGLFRKPLIAAAANLTLGNVTFDASATIDSFNLIGGTSVKFNPHGSNPPHVLRIKNITPSPAAQINMTDNVVIVDYIGGFQSPTLDAIQALINAARTPDGTWTGPGLGSSSARISYDQNTTLGAIEASDYIDATGSTTFAGQPIDSTCVLVKYTYYGDTDFNDAVDGDDYARLDNGMNSGIGGWFNGDADGSGSVDADDYGLIDNAFNTQRPQPAVKFTNPESFAVGIQPHTSVAVDLNGDDMPELIATNENSGSISILRNLMTESSTIPSFAPAQTIPAGVLPVSVAPVHVNNDGKFDLAIANAGPPFKLQILLNNTPDEATSFTFHPPVFLDTGDRPRFVVAADLNGDLKQDLTTANFWADSLSVFVNQTDDSATVPSFAPKKDIVYGSNGPVTLTTGDYNQDNKPDLAVANENAASVSVLRNTTTNPNIVEFAPALHLDTGSTPRFVTTADFNDDDAPDLVVANHGLHGTNNTISVLRNTTLPNTQTLTFANPRQPDLIAGAGPISVAVGRINSDNRPDIAVSNFLSHTVTLMLNVTPSKAENFSFAGRTNIEVGFNPIYVGLIDLNDDGKDDLATADYYGNSVSVLLNALA
jgi:hypothetical protein